MAEYYGVTRSPEYLAHYGIKGMKWGVRKAIESGNARKLSRQYAKAQKKLAKLKNKANLGLQKANAKKYGRISKISGAIGAAGAGVSGVSHLLRNRNEQAFTKNLGDTWQRLHPKTNWGSYNAEEFVSKNPYAKKMHGDFLDKNTALRRARAISGGVGALGLATSAVTGAKALASKYRTTVGGHAAAVARANNFEKEMNKAFAGTKYANGANRGNAGKTKQYVVDLRSRKKRARAGATGKRVSVRYV